MTLTLADIERWDPAAIGSVFEAAIKRSRGTRTASAALTETMRLLDFGGDAAEAAHAVTQHTTLILDTHADSCEAVGRAAQRSADEVAAVRQRLQAIRDVARDHHVTINDAMGTALPPADLSAYSLADQQLILDTAARLTDSIRQLLADADIADEDLAAAIRGADGDLSPEQVNTQLRHEPPKMAPVPAAGTDPAAVSTWWRSLTPAQQDRVKDWFPNSIRNLDGIPADTRNELNVPVLQRELDRLQRGWWDRNGVWRTDPEKRADLQALQRTLAANADCRLILLDTTGNPRKVLAAVGIGDVDNADRVGVTVGGMNTRLNSSVAGMVAEARTQRGKASELRRYAGTPNCDAVASIAWLGYDAPESLKDVAHDWQARAGAASLASFYRGLAATTNVVDQHIAAFGHSYGSLTTSLALQHGAPVSDVVLYGSPGTELTNAAQLGVQPGHAFYLIGVNDHVAEVISDLGAFGPAAQDVPGMVELSTSTGLALSGKYGDGRVHERAYGHSEYARVGSNGELRMSGYNMAAVLAGLPDDLITPRARGVDRLPGGSGPYELPAPMPRHHL